MRRQLLGWYTRHARALPWRDAAGECPDAYRVWVSEIMLQQTRVAVVMGYYQRFLARFPDARVLARAPETAVLAAWSGLGYYRRARRLQAAARIIAARHGGRFPLQWEAARALPGIGDYTAAAVLSIAGGEPLAAVDGNGLRVARRFLDRPLTPAQAREHWTAWLARRRAGAFNQAVMDLGATVCTPRAPRCTECPLRRRCRSRGARPDEGRRRPSRKLSLHYALAQRGARVWLRQRPADAQQMPGLWELPALQTPSGEPLASFRHTITTTRITACVFAVPRPRGRGRWFARTAALALPLTGLARKMLRRLGWAVRPRLPPARAGRFVPKCPARAR